MYIGVSGRIVSLPDGSTCFIHRSGAVHCNATVSLGVYVMYTHCRELSPNGSWLFCTDYYATPPGEPPCFALSVLHKPCFVQICIWCHYCNALCNAQNWAAIMFLRKVMQANITMAVEITILPWWPLQCNLI